MKTNISRKLALILALFATSCSCKKDNSSDEAPVPTPNLITEQKKPSTQNAIPETPFDTSKWGKSLYFTTNTDFRTQDNTPTLNFIKAPKNSKVQVFNSKDCHDLLFEKVIDSNDSQLTFNELEKGIYEFSFKILLAPTKKASDCASRVLTHTYRPDSKIKKVLSSYLGYTILREDGSVIAWGNDQFSDNYLSREMQLFSDVIDIATTPLYGLNVAALKKDGSVVFFGKQPYNKKVEELEKSIKNIKKIIAFDHKFALISESGALTIVEGNEVSSPSTASLLQSGVLDVKGSGKYYFAVKDDRSIVYLGKESISQNVYNKVKDVVSNGNAYAILHDNGIVIAGGAANYGGVVPPAKVALLYSSSKLMSNNDGFTVLTKSGAVVSWGRNEPPVETQNVLNANVQEIFANENAFAALMHDKSVVSWGNGDLGGNSEAVKSELRQIKTVIPTRQSFYAINESGKAIHWGSTREKQNFDKAQPFLQSNVFNIYGNTNATVALKSNGSLVPWGENYNLESFNKIKHLVSSGVVGVLMNEGSFLALKEDGSIVTWGISNGHIVNKEELMQKNAVDLYQYYASFYLYDKSGHLYNINNDHSYFEKMPQFDSPVSKLIFNPFTVTFLQKNGSVKIQDTFKFKTPDETLAELKENIVEIVANEGAFAALKNDGSVFTWGEARYGGNTSDIFLGGGVKKIYSHPFGFIAQKNDETLLAWGNPVFLDMLPTDFNHLKAKKLAISSNKILIEDQDGKVYFISLEKEVLQENLAEKLRIFKKFLTSSSGNEGVVLSEKNEAITFVEGKETEFSVTNKELFNNINSIVSNNSDYAALKNDGSVVTWNADHVIELDSETKAKLSNGVKNIFSSNMSFLAQKDDGTFVIWGKNSNNYQNISSYLNPNATYKILDKNFTESFMAIDEGGKVWALEGNETLTQGVRIY